MEKQTPREETNEASKQWAENELASLKIKDTRNMERLKKVASDFHAKPGCSIPQASGNRAAAKAVYRIIEGGCVRAGEVLASHAEAGKRRIRESGEKVLLVPQDTTSLNFASHPHTEGLGPIGKKTDKEEGFLAHSSLCVGAGGGEVFGLLGVKMWVREKNKCKKQPAGARNRQRIGEKESERWLESWRKTDELYWEMDQKFRVVSVADREGDIYELFAQCLENKEAKGGGADLLVRAQHDRKRVGAGENAVAGKWSQLQGQDKGFSHTIEVPRQRGKSSRQAVLEVRYGSVQLETPAHKRKHLGLEKPLDLQMVTAVEVNPPPGEEPVCWRLWTTVEIDSQSDAVELLGWYAKRWIIEEFHRTLKSGCKTEERQLESFEKLSLTVALDMMVAVSLLALTKAVRQDPEASAERNIRPEQWKALHCYFNKTRIVPETPPDLKTAVGWIARLGGFLGRKGDGFPGTQVLWRGWVRMVDITATFQILNGQEKCG